MISWNVSNSKDKRKNWFFPSFEVQEYLLPIIDIGGSYIDEYGDTTYSVEDCMRLRKVIDNVIEGLSLTKKTRIRFETMHKGLETLDKPLLIEALKNLREATEIAVEKRQPLVFRGD
ncbi:hypothetical protein ACONUD_05785 [Microbulbifer harenosus]|uniref:Uncharacterized protein n=1 Tax=Microbulbifer harenosus TaxID=2576840 RepID=A0ABY2UJB6_9GAMM|nr:hypothetical protein [Microbulbifer harenosus]TLM77815.1 hypothetical protein FDY93_09540 [Microbulbifer harenosus]